MTPTLIIMTKVPRAGQVKTRLGRDIGMTAAAWWFRHQSRSLIRRLQDPRWTTVLAVAPDHAGLQFRGWPGHLQRLPQGRGDLGQRMHRALCMVPAGPVCLVGADLPALTCSHIARAFARLGNHDMVFGPASDGGYWLVGAKHPRRLPHNLFQGVRWSSPHALSDTLATVPDQRIALTDTLHDVDRAKDLPQRP